MKAFAILCAIVFAATGFSPASAAAHIRICTSDADSDNLFRDGNVEVDFHDGSLVMTHEDGDETVEITEKYDLIVNGRPVHLARDQRKLVEEYYESFEYIVEEAKAIGIQGAKVGAQGAALGVAAVLGVLKLLSPDYDSEDLDRELNHKSDKIEHVAAKLEKRAKRLERRANALEDLHGQLRTEIDALDDLGWF